MQADRCPDSSLFLEDIDSVSLARRVTVTRYTIQRFNLRLNSVDFIVEQNRAPSEHAGTDLRSVFIVHRECDTRSNERRSASRSTVKASCSGKFNKAPVTRALSPASKERVSLRTEENVESCQ